MADRAATHEYATGQHWVNSKDDIRQHGTGESTCRGPGGQCPGVQQGCEQPGHLEEIIWKKFNQRRHFT